MTDTTIPGALTPRRRTDTVAVIGATGQQGGAVATSLLEAGIPVRAVTRSATSAAAQALLSRGADVVEADLEDTDSTAAALDGARRVFGMTSMDGGAEAEFSRGRSLVDAAVRAGVDHMVFSSVGGADRDTGVPHFESKWEVERYLAASPLSAAVVRPTFFMENLAVQDGAVDPDGTPGTVLPLPLPDEVPLQMIAVADIGAAAAGMLIDPTSTPSAVEIAGDERTGSQMADAFAAALGRPVHYTPLPTSGLPSEDLRAMFTWFTEPVAYRADWELTRALVGEPMTLKRWTRGAVAA